ncbi:hypothetical protein BYZ73_10060 [Rhodovulum viride]|uniref:Uncharacterized protein n=1 Tax=Rhodovulum viride TaxID=1231134 RepID=A0ABX9DIS5_9RHOB|nr:hypothetical protein [Rhodovulum viride]RAP41594.1 hypothetical protein BYZ73_10060 [Rhodovulum viride]
MAFDDEGLSADRQAIRTRLGDAAASFDELEDAARRLGEVFLDALDGSGGAAFASWLVAERENAAVIRAEVLEPPARHPDTPRGAVQN